MNIDEKFAEEDVFTTWKEEQIIYAIVREQGMTRALEKKFVDPRACHEPF